MHKIKAMFNIIFTNIKNFDLVNGKLRKTFKGVFRSLPKIVPFYGSSYWLKTGNYLILDVGQGFE